jgi:hypothetical protein
MIRFYLNLRCKNQEIDKTNIGIQESTNYSLSSVTDFRTKRKR